jgi:hypothetical protein
MDFSEQPFCLRLKLRVKINHCNKKEKKKIRKCPLANQKMRKEKPSFRKTNNFKIPSDAYAYYN